MQTRSAGRTDVGRRRPHNEDAFLCDDDISLYVVADGVGGNAKGEVASAESVEMVRGWIRQRRKLLHNHAATPTAANSNVVRRLLESGVQSACYMVFGMGQVDPRQKGMSSTLSSLLVSAGIGFIAQVGDSRVYLLRGGKIKQLTDDHTLVNYRLKLGLITPEEAANAPGKNVITRAVGHQDYVEVDTFEVDVQTGDRFLLCSDGLHGYVEDSELPKLARGDKEAAAKALIDLANARGGRDNITVVLCDVDLG